MLEADQTENDDELDESALCANAGGIFTNGENAAYPGCDCSCCKGMVYTHYHNGNLIWRTVSRRVDEVIPSDHPRRVASRVIQWYGPIHET